MRVVLCVSVAVPLWFCGVSGQLKIAPVAGGLAGARGIAWAFRVHPDQRDIALSYTARMRTIPGDARELRIWIPLAQTSAEQEILQRTVHAPVPYTIEREPVYGNEILSLLLTPPFPSGLEVSVEYRALLRGGGALTYTERQPSPRQLQRYQSAEGLVVVDDEVRARAQLATAGGLTLEERALGIYDHVIQRMAYDKSTPGWGRGDTRRACELGKGNCTDFHSLFISMARAARIPARFKIGVVVPNEPAGTIPGYHCWAEFYEEGRGWVSVDASEAWKHPERSAHYFGSWDANRFLISVGRHLELVPPQRGTPVNIFLYPYVEVDGHAVEGVETDVRFRDLQQVT